MAMEVESEEVDCYPSPFVFNSSQPILKGLDSQAIQPEIDSQLTQPEQESQPSDDDEDNIETVDLEKVENTSNEKTEDWEPSEKAEDNVEKKEIETKEEKVEMRKFTIGVLVDETEESDKDDSSDEIGHDTSDKPGTDANTLDANKSGEATHNQDAEPTPNVVQPTGLEVSNKREDSPASRDPRRLGRKSTEPNSVKIKTEDMAGSSNVIPSPFVGAALPPPNLDKGKISLIFFFSIQQFNIAKYLIGAIIRREFVAIKYMAEQQQTRLVQLWSNLQFLYIVVLPCHKNEWPFFVAEERVDQVSCQFISF